MTAFSGVRRQFSLWVLSALFEEIKAVNLWKEELPCDILGGSTAPGWKFSHFVCVSVSKFVFPIMSEISLLKIGFYSLTDI